MRLDQKEAVRASTDIVDLAGRYLDIQRYGAMFRAKCPWHDDRRPSLTLNPVRQSFRCWVCDLGGDVFDFVSKIENLSFPESVQFLAERAGIVLDDDNGRAAETKGLRDLMEFAAKQFRKQRNDVSRTYVESRGIDREMAKQFKIGFAPDSWDALTVAARGAGFTDSQLVLGGLAVEGDRGVYDRFRNRLIFPVHDERGRTIAFGGRAMPGNDAEKAKYINSPETPLFSKHRVLYGLDIASKAIREAGYAIIVEGYTDAIAAHQHGINNTVACLGTAVGTEHTRILKRYCERAVLLLDGDDAGRKRANEVLATFLASEIEVRVITLPNGMDPGEFLADHSGAELQRMIDVAPDAIDHRLQSEYESAEGKGEAAAERAIAELCEMLAAIKPGVRIDRAAARIAAAFRLTPRTVLSRVDAVRAVKTPSYKPETPAPIVAEPTEQVELTPEEHMLLMLLVRDTQSATLVLEEIFFDALSPDAKRVFGVFLDCRDRMLSLAYESVIAESSDAGVIDAITRAADLCDLEPDTGSEHEKVASAIKRFYAAIEAKERERIAESLDPIATASLFS